jgi:hypothetical protein
MPASPPAIAAVVSVSSPKAIACKYEISSLKEKSFLQTYD